MISFPGVYGHWQQYLLDKRKICMNCNVHCHDVTNTSVIVKNNCCAELVGGEFFTTIVQMPPRLPARLCMAAKLTSGKSTSRWKRNVLESTSTTRLRTVVITLFWLHLHYL